jgi:sec-independent protein translocase protein TatC
MAEEEKNMSFLGHLEELRWRLVKATIAILIAAVVIFIYVDPIVEHVFKALAKADFPLNRFFCWSMNWCAEDVKMAIQNTELTGQFVTTLMISILGGIVLAFPYIFYQIWGFVKPGLKEKEQKKIRGVVAFVSVLFFIGIAFGYYVIAPLTVQFFGNWQIADIKNDIRINDYLRVVTSTIFFTGLLFLLPVIVLIFSRLGIITSAWLKKYRKHSFIAVLILAAIITPPDLFTQIIVSIPIVILYEFGIWLAKRVEKQGKKDRA